MGFFDHIEVLRGHLFRSVLAIVILTAACLIKSKWIFDHVIFGPVRSDFLTYRVMCKVSAVIRPKLCAISPLLCPEDGMCVQGLNVKFMNTELFGQFITQIQMSFVMGLIVAVPYIIYEIWRFIRPALSAREARISGRIVGFSGIFFFIGVLFAYFIIVPFSINFAANYLISDQISNLFTLDNYIGFVTMMLLGCGLIFELPMIIFFLAKMGIITADFMREYRRYAIVVILILAAFITPSPDMFTMMLVAIPIYILYEISIVVAARVGR